MMQKTFTCGECGRSNKKCRDRNRVIVKNGYGAVIINSWICDACLLRRFN